jgi:hypothetical protein
MLQNAANKIRSGFRDSTQITGPIIKRYCKINHLLRTLEPGNAEVLLKNTKKEHMHLWSS